MNHKLVALAAASLLLLPVAVRAQERVGDAALGALSGAVVLGPVGAVAGAFVGYTAGPHIAGAWGVRHSRRARAARAAPAARPAGVAANEAAPSAPVGTSAVSTAAGPEHTSAAAVTTPATSAPATVPVQGFE